VLKYLYILILVVLLGTVDGNCAVNREIAYSSEEAYIIDQMRDYCQLVSDNWSGVPSGEIRHTTNYRVVVNVHFNFVYKSRKNITDRIQCQRILASNESDVQIIHSDKIYHVIALRRIII
jgi:hypothetical protein